MDPFSHRLANALVGNSGETATLEATLSGPVLQFESDCVIAIAGAEFVVTVDGHIAPYAQAVAVPSHSTVEFGRRLRGARAYIAVDGGFDVPPTLGSRATHVASRLGGFEGRPLRKSDRLPLGSPAGRRPAMRTTTHAHDMLMEPAVVRVLRGPDEDRFLTDAFDALQSDAYAIDLDSNRMGYRLHGPELHHSHGADIISDVTPIGTLQVPASGQPILLMADRQTTGGYPRMATVISADLGIAGQRAPGETLSFRLCSTAEALAALIARENALLALEAAMS
jgi:antagonist of KipI